jgi:hypothetical protein
MIGSTIDKLLSQDRANGAQPKIAGTEPMSVKLSRRLLVSLLGTVGAVIAFGADAQQQTGKAPQGGIGTPLEGTSQFVGPVIAESTKDLSRYVGDLPTSQRIELRPSQTIDRTGYHLNVKE